VLTVIIPSKTEKYFKRTIEDVLEKATGEIEIYAVTDGYEEVDKVKDNRVIYLKLDPSEKNQKRHGINKAVSLCCGDYVMALDAHCMVDKGFDTQLIKDHQPNWVQVPQRRRLDAENWCEQDQCGKPPIAYEYFMWRSLIEDHGLHGYKWDSRTLERQDILLDDTLCIQASTWFMTKKWFQDRGFMNVERYTGWGAECEEIVFETLKADGRVVTNKNTNYYHLHKGSKYGRMYHLNRSEQKISYDSSYNHWVIENKDFFIKIINKFMPIPNWPDDWEYQLYGK
jgi:hypothetical protein